MLGAMLLNPVALIMLVAVIGVIYLAAIGKEIPIVLSMMILLLIWNAVAAGCSPRMIPPILTAPPDRCPSGPAAVRRRPRTRRRRSAPAQSDVAAVTALLDRLLHHAHVLKCGPRSWRTKVQTSKSFPIRK